MAVVAEVAGSARLCTMRLIDALSPASKLALGSKFDDIIIGVDVKGLCWESGLATGWRQEVA